MAQVIRCVLACKRFAEKEAISKGFEALKIKEDIKVEEKTEESETKDDKETRDDKKIKDDKEIKDDFMEIIEPEIEEVESEGENGEDAAESDCDEETMGQTEYETTEYETEYETTEYETEYESEMDTSQPEVVLIDSPVYADDESESQNILNTQENPGTFEIQVTN